MQTSRRNKLASRTSFSMAVKYKKEIMVQTGNGGLFKKPNKIILIYHFLRIENIFNL